MVVTMMPDQRVAVRWGQAFPTVGQVFTRAVEIRWPRPRVLVILESEEVAPGGSWHAVDVDPWTVPHCRGVPGRGLGPLLPDGSVGVGPGAHPSAGQRAWWGAAAVGRDRRVGDPLHPKDGDRGPWVRRGSSGPGAVRPRCPERGDTPQRQTRYRPATGRAPKSVPPNRQMANRSRGPDQHPETWIRLGPNSPGRPRRSEKLDRTGGSSPTT